MKSVEPKLANQLVRTLGLKDICDSNKLISKDDIEKALEIIDSKLLDELANVYKNRVSKRVKAGVQTPKHLLCLLRRVLRRHNVLVSYNKKFRKRKAIFSYNLLNNDKEEKHSIGKMRHDVHTV
jgi:hypothetical protein